jgi:hypothetical protein
MTKLTTVGMKKDVKPKIINGEVFISTTKRKDFDLVMAGICPHCRGNLGDEIRGSGVGVTRTCESCHHRWYLHKRIKRTRCLDCFSEQRRNKRNTSRNNDSLRPLDSQSQRLDTLNGTTYNNSGYAGMAEMADAADLKSAGAILVGSSPSPGTDKGS